MTAIIASTHTLAALGLWRSIKKQDHHQEEYITLLLVVAIALSSLASLIFDLSSGL